VPAELRQHKADLQANVDILFGCAMVVMPK
jgi:hypothetical protein